MAELTLRVNGETRTVEADPETPLVFVLRNQLGLTGPKIGCAQEQCSACAVLVDGERSLSCVRAASEFVDAEIVTVEGLAPGGVLNPVQRAFLEEGAAQCGYCTPGIVIAATALFARTPHPSDQEIRDALSDQLCRCGSHPLVLTALRKLAGRAA